MLCIAQVLVQQLQVQPGSKLVQQLHPREGPLACL